MSIDHVETSTNSGDSILLRSSALENRTERSSSTSLSIDNAQEKGFSSDANKSWRIASEYKSPIDSRFESSQNQDQSYVPNTKRYLSVPPLASNLYQFPKFSDTNIFRREFQAIHPNKQLTSLSMGISRKESLQESESSNVINIADLPDPYRLKLLLSSSEVVNRNSDVKSTVKIEDTNQRQVSDQLNLKTSDSAKQSDQTTNTRYSDALLGAAFRSLGTQPWQKSEYANYVDKSLAGASSVSQILQEQGFEYANSGSAANLAKKLMVNGWRLVPKSNAKAGDIIFGGKKGSNWRNGRGLADIGIVGTNDQIFHNDANSGEWRLNKQSRVFSKGQYGDQVWVLRAPEKSFPKESDQAPFPKFDRNLGTNDSQYENCYRCRQSCRYFDDFAKRQEGKPKPYLNSNDSAASAGARDGKRAYEEMRRRNSKNSDSNFKGFRYDESDRRNSENQNIENPNKYWNNYWKNYWRDYWKEYYSKTNDGSDKQVRPNNAKPGDHGKSIHDAAKGKIGQSVWQSSPHADKLQNGRLGSATSVSEILKSLGYSYATSPGVANLAKQLLSAGWTPVKLTELRPGDVIYGAKNSDWEQSGGKSHMSIVGNDGQVLHNDSNTGKFKADKVGDVYDQATYGNRIWALRPPEKGPQNQSERQVPIDRQSNNDRTSPSNRSEKGARNILQAALTSVGKKMYRILLPESQARLGCAASVSGVLQKAGFKYAKHASVYGLSKQLVGNGWQKLSLSQAQPGDVVIGIRRSSWKSGGGGSHIGIVGDGNKSYQNSSARRQWVSSTFSYWRGRQFRLGAFVLRPPGNR